jgi:hypothetical protein
MTTMRDPEAILAAWLDEGPEELPDGTRRAIANALPTITQARRGRLAPWRLLQMNTTARLAVGALVAIAVAGGALYMLGSRPGVGYPTVTPSPPPLVSPTIAPSTPSAIDTSDWQTFTSSIHGISVAHPSVWTVNPASAAWDGKQFPEPPSPMLDVLTGPDDSAFAILSSAIPVGTRHEDWVAAYRQPYLAINPAECWPPVAEMEQITVDGQTAWLHGGVGFCGFTEAVTFLEGRAYILTAYQDPTMQTYPIFDRQLFDAFLSGVRLDPAAAAPGPSEPPSPPGPAASSPTPS